jgi:Na+-transporting methylmalonyl-CoA/oxaloacetate decarboxylase gamma subunit
MTNSVMTNFLTSLEIMWKGMAALFVVCGFVMVTIMVIGKVLRRQRD